MTENMLKNLHKDLETFRKEAQEIEERLSAAGEDNKALKRELSIALFKCAICEGIINREKENG